MLQIADALAGAVPQLSMADRLDHLGVPATVRPALPVIKVAASAGLVAGLKRPRLGAVTCVGLMAFYAAAVGFHGFAGDAPAAGLPAAAFGASAALCLFCCFLPAVEARDPK